jgi:hypothetical protein
VVSPDSPARFLTSSNVSIIFNIPLKPWNGYELQVYFLIFHEIDSRMHHGNSLQVAGYSSVLFIIGISPKKKEFIYRFLHPK